MSSVFHDSTQTACNRCYTTQAVHQRGGQVLNFLPFQRLLHNAHVICYTVREMNNVSYTSGHLLKQFNTVKHQKVSVTNFHTWNHLFFFTTEQKKIKSVTSVKWMHPVTGIMHNLFFHKAKRTEETVCCLQILSKHDQHKINQGTI